MGQIHLPTVILAVLIILAIFVVLKFLKVL